MHQYAYTDPCIHTKEETDRTLATAKNFCNLTKLKCLGSPQNMQEMPLLVGNGLNTSSAHHIIYAKIYLTLQAMFFRSFLQINNTVTEN